MMMDHLCTACNAAISGWQGLCLGGTESLLRSLADCLEQPCNLIGVFV